MFYYRLVVDTYIAAEARNRKEAARFLWTKKVVECKRLASTRIQSEKMLRSRGIWDGSVIWLTD